MVLNSERSSHAAPYVVGYTLQTIVLFAPGWLIVVAGLRPLRSPLIDIGAALISLPLSLIVFFCFDGSRFTSLVISAEKMETVRRWCYPKRR